VAHAFGQTIILPLECCSNFVFVFCTRETKQFEQLDVSWMRADVSQLEHPQIVTSPPLPTQRPDSVVDCQGVCTLSWVEPNTDIAAVLGTEWSCMFLYNGILCNLQNCNDSSERGATRALLLHL